MDAPSVDVPAATGFLRERLGGRVSDVVPAPRQGDWSRTFFFREDGRDLVVRFAPWPDNFEKDRAIAARYSSPRLPVPRVVEVGDAPACSYAISERAFGSILEDLDEPRFRRALPSLFAALDAMREAPLDSSGFGAWRPDGSGESASWREYLLGVAADPGDAFPDRPHGWHAKLAARPDDRRTFEAAYDRLETLVPECPEIRHLLHADLLYGNVLVADRGLGAVLDWGCALVGDFLYDVAWLTFWAPWFPGLAAVDIGGAARAHLESRGVDLAGFDARLRCYEVHVGLAGLVYQAFTDDWDEYARTGARLRRLPR